MVGFTIRIWPLWPPLAAGVLIREQTFHLVLPKSNKFESDNIIYNPDILINRSRRMSEASIELISVGNPE